MKPFPGINRYKLEETDMRKRFTLIELLVVIANIEIGRAHV